MSLPADSAPGFMPDIIMIESAYCYPEVAHME